MKLNEVNLKDARCGCHGIRKGIKKVKTVVKRKGAPSPDILAICHTFQCVKEAKCVAFYNPICFLPGKTL